MTEMVKIPTFSNFSKLLKRLNYTVERYIFLLTMTFPTESPIFFFQKRRVNTRNDTKVRLDLDIRN